MSKRVKWLNSRGPYPCNIAYCPTEKSLRHIWPTLTDAPIPDNWCNHNGARVWVIADCKNDLVPTYIICCNPGPNLNWPDTVAMIAHEAVHVCQYLWQQIGEHTPGQEAEAYLVQSIVREILKEMGMPERHA